MANLRAIINKNTETFYDYRSGKRISVAPRLVKQAVAAALLTLFLEKIGEDFIDTILTIQSVLVGFTFSVIFFLVSSRQVKISKPRSLEDGVRVDRVNKLSSELFYNVSYYCVINVLSLGATLLLRVPAWSLDRLPDEIENWARGWLMGYGWVANLLLDSVFVGLSFLLYFLLIESAYTLVRIVIRINFYFSEKLEIEAKNDS